MSNNQSSFESIDDIQIYLLDKLFSEGEFVTTRELNTLELCNVNFSLTNPRNRITYNTARKWKYPLAIGEFAWHVSGSDQLDFISYYARQWENFSSDSKTINQSCYGHKIFNKDISSGESQWDRLIRLLKQDKYSRRAVLDLYDSYNGIDYFSKDIACACTVQFLIRNEKVDAIVNMRSNDIIWGLPYDIYLFTMLQEMVCLELECELGNYHHNVGSMHIYERHYSLGQDMLNCIPVEVKSAMPMDDLLGLEEFLYLERIIRLENNLSYSDISSSKLSSYWKDLLVHLLDYKISKSLKRPITKSFLNVFA